MPQWDDAYELERWGYWEEKMRDHKRFLDRIRRVNGVLEQVLTEEHRIRIWNDRFAINRWQELEMNFALKLLLYEYCMYCTVIFLQRRSYIAFYRLVNFTDDKCIFKN